MLHIMTVGLLNAYRWCVDCPPSWKSRAMDGLRNTLTQGFTGSPATERGDQYESRVNIMLNDGVKFGGVEKPLANLRGMKQQQWIHPLTVEARVKDKLYAFVFRGKMDYYLSLIPL